MNSYPNREFAKVGNRMFTIKNDIINEILRNDKIAKLLYFNEEDALSKDLRTSEKQKLLDPKGNNRRIFDSQLSGIINNKVRSEVRVFYESFQYPSDISIVPFINVHTIVHTDLLNLTGDVSSRHDELTKEIMDTLHGFSTTTVGTLHCVEVSSWALFDTSFIGYHLLFKGGEIHK